MTHKIIIETPNTNKTTQIFQLNNKEFDMFERILLGITVQIEINEFYTKKYGNEKAKKLIDDIIERYGNEEYFDEDIINGD